MSSCTSDAFSNTINRNKPDGRSTKDVYKKLTSDMPDGVVVDDSNKIVTRDGDLNDSSGNNNNDNSNKNNDSNDLRNSLKQAFNRLERKMKQGFKSMRNDHNSNNNNNNNNTKPKKQSSLAYSFKNAAKQILENEQNINIHSPRLKKFRERESRLFSFTMYGYFS